MVDHTWPRISIVTPSYNQGRFLEETILSVLNQDYPNLEYIVIDGGSADNSAEIIKKHQRRLTYWASNRSRGSKLSESKVPPATWPGVMRHWRVLPHLVAILKQQSGDHVARLER